MYAPTSMPLVRRTRATFRRAEFGFFGVTVYTRVQTPRRWGDPFNAGVFVLTRRDSRPFLTSCCTVGIRRPSFCALFASSTRGFPSKTGPAGPGDGAPPVHAAGTPGISWLDVLR